MHFRKELLFLITASIMLLFMIGCGEDEIEEPPSTPQTASALLQSTYPYGEEVYATYSSSGNLVNYRTDLLLQNLPEGFPAISHENFMYKTYLTDGIEADVAAEFSDPQVVDIYQDPDNLNIPDRYGFHTYQIVITENLEDVTLDTVVLFEVEVLEELYTRVVDNIINNDGIAQNMMIEADTAGYYVELAEIDTTRVNNSLEEIEGYIEDIIAENAQIMELNEVAEVPPIYNTAMSLEEKCQEMIEKIHTALSYANSDLQEYKTRTLEIVGENGTKAIFENVHALIRFYPTYFYEEASAQVTIEGTEITVTVNSLKRLPEGWVYKIWLNKGEDIKEVITFNTNNVGSAVTFSKLESYPADYDKIIITIEPYELFEVENTSTGIRVLEGDIKQ